MKSIPSAGRKATGLSTCSGQSQKACFSFLCADSNPSQCPILVLIIVVTAALAQHISQAVDLSVSGQPREDSGRTASEQVLRQGRSEALSV